eukprot:15361509-Ditylum_brightwellii.AAC.1
MDSENDFLVDCQYLWDDDVRIVSGEEMLMLRCSLGEYWIRNGRLMGLFSITSKEDDSVQMPLWYTYNI